MRLCTHTTALLRLDRFRTDLCHVVKFMFISAIVLLMITDNMFIGSSVSSVMNFCQAQNCTRSPSYGNNRVRFHCARHKLPNEVDMKRRLCRWPEVHIVLHSRIFAQDVVLLIDLISQFQQFCSGMSNNPILRSSWADNVLFKP